MVNLSSCKSCLILKSLVKSLFYFLSMNCCKFVATAAKTHELSAKLSENKLTVTLGDNQYYLNTLAAEQFPHIQQKTDDVVLSIRQRDMKYLLKKTAFSMAQNNAQYALNGLLVETKPGKAKCCCNR